MIQKCFARSHERKLVDEVQQHILEALRPLSRPPVEHEVELPGVVDGLRSHLLECKVSVCTCRG